MNEDKNVLPWLAQHHVARAMVKVVLMMVMLGYVGIACYPMWLVVHFFGCVRCTVAGSCYELPLDVHVSCVHEQADCDRKVSTRQAQVVVGALCELVVY
jgi:hypothetical protein